MPRGEPPDLVRDLLRSDAYPPPRPEKVELAATHASWVFLTETEAWKVKRPVDYGFLDYSNLEKRRHACEEEVRLNRRLAPEVYVGVHPVYRDAEGHSFSRPGDVVDWAVRMRRLPDSASAEAMVERGELAPCHLDLLARRLARFFAEAPRRSDHGSTSAIRAEVRQNFEQTRPCVGTLVPAETFEQVRRWQTAFVESNATRFEDRARDGRVREGHGDLRLEHVYYLDGDPVVIDAIEFNEAFRCIDTGEDAAFLAMELEFHRRPDLAGWFLARIALWSNDYDFYPLADFHLSLKAWVRGKVAAFIAADPTTPADKRRRKEGEARAMFELARAFMEPETREPCVVVIGGLIGSGKTTLAETLSARTGWPVVGSDPTRKGLAGLDPTERGGEELYTTEMTRRTYGEMLRRADVVLSSRRAVILDATFPRRAWRDEARRLAERRGVPFLFVETHAPEEILRRRLRDRARGPSVSDAGEDLLARFARDFEPADELPDALRLRVDTSVSPAKAASAVLNRLSTKGTGPSGG